jgi:prespore-specific regulator
MAIKNVFQRGITMTRIRQDAWTQDNDKVLADIVLNHIRSGSTQLAAFDDVAELLQRSSSACGFRWNAEVRKRYKSEINEAKSMRQKVKASSQISIATVSVGEAAQREIFVTVSQVKDQNDVSSDYLDQIINLAQIQKLQLANMEKQIKTLNEQLNEKEMEIERLKRKLDEAKVQPSEVTVNEDYNTLLQILQRARQLGAIEEGVRRKASV